VSDPSPEPSRSRRQGRGAQRSTLAARGLVRVGVDFAQEYPDGDAGSTEAFASLARTGTALLQELERTIGTSFDMSQAAATTLAVVEGADEPLTPSQISERVVAASATMTATLDLLERRGWIVRQPNTADRRSVLVSVTDEGRAVADRLLPGVRVVEREVMSALTAKERDQLLRLLGKVLARAAEVAEAPPTPLDGRRRRPRSRSRRAT
jgi:DNA-binding MarR family transcriptional regulator